MATVSDHAEKSRVEWVEQQETRRALSWKMGQSRIPLAQMKIVYPESASNRKEYSEDEDRFLLCMLHKHGVVGNNIYDAIRNDIWKFRLFRYNWFILSRTVIEIRRRCNTLLGFVRREWESAGKPNDATGKDVSKDGQPGTTIGETGPALDTNTQLPFRHNLQEQPTDRPERDRVNLDTGTTG